MWVKEGCGLRKGVGYGRVWVMEGCGLRKGVGYGRVWVKKEGAQDTLASMCVYPDHAVSHGPVLS